MLKNRCKYNRWIYIYIFIKIILYYIWRKGNIIWQAPGLRHLPLHLLSLVLVSTLPRKAEVEGTKDITVSQAGRFCYKYCTLTNVYKILEFKGKCLYYIIYCTSSIYSISLAHDVKTAILGNNFKVSPFNRANKKKENILWW